MASSSKTNPVAVTSVDEYIAACSPQARSILRKIRTIIRGAVPGVGEKISYRMPAFTLNGRILLYVAAFKRHLGMYPPLRDAKELELEVAPYRGEKGNLKFPFAEPVPYDLIERIARAKAAQLRDPGDSAPRKRQAR